MQSHSSSTSRHGLTTPLLLGVLASSLLACFEPTSVVCPRSGRICAVACSADGEVCISDLCGNARIDPGEVCDDGNLRSGDSCSQDCRSEELCGNGYTDEVKGEACDDGNTLDGDGCSADCRSKESCGNKIVDPLEQCDDGNDNDLDDCLKGCKLARCGDGLVNSQGLVTEACDYKNPQSGPCNLNCTVAVCGDGLVSPSTEQCDNGTHEDSATCNVDCTVPRCGDGYVNRLAGEECDDGNTDDQDACLSTCRPNRCGDGILNPGREVCDDGNAGQECPYGSRTCTVCNASCALEVLSGPYCGDGLRNGGEQCDLGKACGTCTAQCTEGAVAPAVGNIRVMDADDIAPGDTLAISDGTRIPVIFELRPTCHGYNGPHRCIGMAPIPRDMALSMTDAIQRASGAGLLGMAATHEEPDGVSLTNERTGAVGNQLIIKRSDGLAVSGMSGGVGFDCAPGDKCSRNEDCVRPLQCKDSPAGKTCQP